eukprot:scaffold310_cov302-Prasinococcus_capsulatus_cf.AAC.10
MASEAVALREGDAGVERRRLGGDDAEDGAESDASPRRASSAPRPATGSGSVASESDHGSGSSAGSSGGVAAADADADADADAAVGSSKKAAAAAAAAATATASTLRPVAPFASFLQAPGDLADAAEAGRLHIVFRLQALQGSGITDEVEEQLLQVMEEAVQVLRRTATHATWVGAPRAFCLRAAAAPTR